MHFILLFRAMCYVIVFWDHGIVFEASSTSKNEAKSVGYKICIGFGGAFEGKRSGNNVVYWVGFGVDERIWKG